jgi:protein required for attachment to host cells
MEAEMLIPHGAHVMVIDGARMSLFRNSGKDFAPRLELVEEHEQRVPRTSSLGSDQPGHSFQNLGSVGGSHEGTDFHQLAEDAFATEAAGKLGALLQNEDARAVLIAAPHMLGVMRKQLDPKQRARLIAEIDKDYAGRPPADVAKLLSGIEV